MDRPTLSCLAHADHPLAAPVGDAAGGRLLLRARPPSGARSLDGCAGRGQSRPVGPGAWLARALLLRPEARAHETAREVAAGHRAEWLRGHHGVPGFACLLLVRTSG